MLPSRRSGAVGRSDVRAVCGQVLVGRLLREAVTPLCGPQRSRRCAIVGQMESAGGRDPWDPIEPELTGTTYVGQFVIEWPVTSEDLEVNLLGQSLWIAYNCGSLEAPAGGVRLDFRGVLVFTYRSFDLFGLFDVVGDGPPADGYAFILRSTGESALLSRARQELKGMERLTSPLKHFHLSANNTATIEVVASDFRVRPFDLPTQWEDPRTPYPGRAELVRDAAGALAAPW